MSEPNHHTRVLDPATCWTLLETVSLGRVAWAEGSGQITVLPVNFVCDGGDVVFLTDPGSKLDAVRAGRPLAFEADDVEPALRTGWSVLVTGHGREVTDAEDVRHLHGLSLAPWVAGGHGVFVRIRAEQVTGRRLPLNPGGVTVLRRDDDPG